MRFAFSDVYDSQLIAFGELSSSFALSAKDAQSRDDWGRKDLQVQAEQE